MAESDTPSGSPAVVADAQALARAARRLGAEIDRDHPDGVVLVGILRGALFTLADVARRVTVPVVVDFLAISSYAPGTGRVRLVKDLDADVTGRDVVLVEDVVDTGLTLAYVRHVVEARGARRVRVCTMLDRRVSRIVPEPIDYVGVEIGDVYAVGHGLDHAGRYRNLPFVASGERSIVEQDPDAWVPFLYGADAPVGARWVSDAGPG